MSNIADTKTFENIIKKMPVQIIGLNTSLKKIYEEIKQFAPHNVPCLITGETGTGKEMIAELVHSLSQCRHAPLIKVNCTSIPSDLFESELFGYEKGAFTGANSTKQGLIELANNGTLFLDEIGELPIQLQPKLLRVLQDNRLYRLGGTKEIRVNFRLISATNINIPDAINKGKFREDLYFRIKAFTINLPPLRSRLEDFEALSLFLISKVAAQLKINPLRIDESAIHFLKSQAWSGNIRQLEQTLTLALVSCQEKGYINTAAIKKYLEKNDYTYCTAICHLSEKILDKKISIDRIREDIIQNVMQKKNFNVKELSEITGYSIYKLYRIRKNIIKTEFSREQLILNV